MQWPTAVGLCEAFIDRASLFVLVILHSHQQLVVVIMRVIDSEHKHIVQDL